MIDTLPVIEIVVPCFNEQEVLPSSSNRLISVINELIGCGKIAKNSRLCFVDDGSDDGTWEFISNLALHNERVSGIKLSKNFGHQSALLAGLFSSISDAVITIDADLQDDVSLIEKMIDSYVNGNQVVYAVRTQRKTDSFFKRSTANMFYAIMGMLGVNTLPNHADFRLTSRAVIDALKQHSEVNLYLRALIRSLGFKSEILTYKRAARTAGETKYTARKMLSLALNGITSFSVAPLRLITLFGFIVFVGSILLSAWGLWLYFVDQKTVPGWASTVLPIYFLGGVQIFSIGVVGEYIGKIYWESKGRPRFIIDTKIG